MALPTAKSPVTLTSPLLCVRMESPIALLPVNIGIIVAVPPPVIPEVPPPPPLGLVIHGWVVNDNPPLPLEIMQVLLAPTVAGKVKVKLLPPVTLPACRLVVLALLALARVSLPVLVEAAPTTIVVVGFVLATTLRLVLLPPCVNIDVASVVAPVNMGRTLAVPPGLGAVTPLPTPTQLPPPPLKATQTSPLAAGMTKVLCPPLGAANVRVVVLPPLVEVSLVLVALLPCRVRGNGEGEMVPTVKVPLDGAIVPALIVPIPLLPTVKMPPTVILLVPV